MPLRKAARRPAARKELLVSNMASRGRQFSVLSTGALNTLDNLTAEIDGATRRSSCSGMSRGSPGRAHGPAAGIEARIVAFEKLDPSDEEKKLNALGEIRQICGDLDKIQATKVDAARPRAACCECEPSSAKRRSAPPNYTRARP